MTSSRQTLSVALCTYNGEAYLPAQWESLLQQERQPDEVIICDDGSTDATRSLIRTLAQEAPFRVVLVENGEQLGYNKNFEKALSLCTGDLVFICDQDDYWLPQKMAVMADFMAADPAVQVAFCNAYVADDQLRTDKEPFWDRVRLDAFQKERWRAGLSMEVLLDGNRMMGCATVIRRAFIPQLLPIPTDIPGYIYDGWISLVGAAHGVIQFVDKPLQLYRTHASQQVGVRADPPGPYVSLRDRFTRDRSVKLEPLVKNRLQLQKIMAYLSERVPAQQEGMKQLHRKLAHYTLRSTLPANRLLRVWPVLSELQRGHYQRYADAATDWYSPYLAALGDLME